MMPIPDLQSERDERHLAINQVGIKGLKFPLSFTDGDGVAQSTIAMCSVYVALAEDRKGTHMSRMVMLLDERLAPGTAPLSVAGLRALLDDLVLRLNAPGGRIELAFPFFVRKTAPISGVASLLDYEVRLTADLPEPSRWPCRSLHCARVRRRSRSTARTTSARRSPLPFAPRNRSSSTT